MTEKKTKADPIVAAADIMVDGKAFAAGDKITGVDKDQLAMATSQKRAIRKSVFDKLAEGVPAPDLGGHLSPDEELALNHGNDGEGDTGEGDEGDTGDTGNAGDTGTTDTNGGTVQ